MIINVKLWNKFVGSLAWDDNRNVAIFEYDDNFVSEGLEIAPLLMPLRAGFSYDFHQFSFNAFNGLTPMLVDSFPDDFGNCIMRAYLSKQGKSIDCLNSVERLGYIGTRGMGALEFEPIFDTNKRKINVVDIHELVDITQRIVFAKEENYSDLKEDSLTKILRTGTSAGGARAKVILTFDEINKVFKPGDTLYGQNHSYWLAKLDGVTNQKLGDPEDYERIEYAYYKMALDAGIDMSDSMLIKKGDRAHFITKRFDRPEGEKIHMQTLSAIAGMDYRQSSMYSYEQVFTVLRKMRLPHADLVRQFRRMVFNVVACNQDDHVKNISFLMDKSGKWSLSPAYDLTYSYNASSLWTGRHQLSINGKHDNFLMDDLLKIGKENNISNRKDIVQQVVDSVRRWPSFAIQAEVNQNQITKIQDNFIFLNKS